jgi:methylmalonyl-CoA epimerase
VRACLIAIGQTRLELLQPLSPDSPVGKFIERRGEGLHHLALHVDDVAESIDGLRSRGVQMIDLEPREGLSGLIAFLHPRSAHGILTELVQTPPQD